jgi:uncharacterized protein YjbK
MMREIELKYKLKNLQDYKALLDVLPGEHHRENQVNYFFDTPNLKLKTQHIFLRLRKSNELYKFTCKAAPIGIPKTSDTLSIHDEWEEIIDNSEAQKLLDGKLSPIDLLSKTRPDEPQNAKRTRLSLLKRVKQTTQDALGLAGFFKNTRIHVPYSIGKYQLDLEFDATDFGNEQIDYELEVELPKGLSPETAQTEISKLFLNQGIKTGPSSGKAERFFDLKTDHQGFIG